MPPNPHKCVHREASKGYGHARWTFGAGFAGGGQALRFGFVALVGLATSSGTVRLFGAGLGLGFGWAMLAVAVLVPAVTYLALRFWVFDDAALRAKTDWLGLSLSGAIALMVLALFWGRMINHDAAARGLLTVVQQNSTLLRRQVKAYLNLFVELWMQIDGYKPHGERHETDRLHVQIAEAVIEFLRREAAGANRQNVKKVGATLELIRKNGLPSTNNNTLFVREGKFPSGQPGMAEIAVFAAKSYQLRVYGGIVQIKNQSVFLCPDGAIKKRDKADRAQLARVAKVLGDHHER